MTGLPSSFNIDELFFTTGAAAADDDNNNNWFSPSPPLPFFLDYGPTMNVLDNNILHNNNTCANNDEEMIEFGFYSVGATSIGTRSSSTSNTPMPTPAPAPAPTLAVPAPALLPTEMMDFDMTNNHPPPPFFVTTTTNGNNFRNVDDLETVLTSMFLCFPTNQECENPLLTLAGQLGPKIRDFVRILLGKPTTIFENNMSYILRSQASDSVKEFMDSVFDKQSHILDFVEIIRSGDFHNPAVSVSHAVEYWKRIYFENIHHPDFRAKNMPIVYLRENLDNKENPTTNNDRTTFFRKINSNRTDTAVGTIRKNFSAWSHLNRPKSHDEKLDMLIGWYFFLFD